MIHVDFAEGTRVASDLDRLAAHFMQWVTPALDAAHIPDDRRAVYESIYRDMSDQLAAKYSNLAVNIHLPGSHSEQELENLAREIRDAMTELFLQLSGVAVISLRRAVLAACDTNADSESS